jgi:hypothetical protein
MNAPKNHPEVVPQNGMKEEEAFRRAQIDPAFRAFILAEWLKSKRKARIFVVGAIVMFCATLLYAGFTSGRWIPNFFWAALVIVALWTQSTARTTIAALRAIDEKEPNQSPEPTPTSVTPPADAGVAPADGVAHL